VQPFDEADSRPERAADRDATGHRPPNLTTPDRHHLPHVSSRHGLVLPPAGDNEFDVGCGFNPAGDALPRRDRDLNGLPKQESGDSSPDDRGNGRPGGAAASGRRAVRAARHCGHDDRERAEQTVRTRPVAHGATLLPSLATAITRTIANCQPSAWRSRRRSWTVM